MLLGWWYGAKRQELSGKRLAARSAGALSGLLQEPEHVSGEDDVERFGGKRQELTGKRLAARPAGAPSGLLQEHERVSGEDDVERFGAKRQGLKKRGWQSSGDPHTPS